MTNKEAIETIKIAIAEVEWEYPMDYAVAFETAIEALEKQVPKKRTNEWNKTSEVKPTEEKQYLCCLMYTDKPFFKVMSWSNNLYEVDKYEFDKGKSGFYAYDSKCGYFEAFCDYWQEIDWSNEE